MEKAKKGGAKVYVNPIPKKERMQIPRRDEPKRPAGERAADMDEIYIYFTEEEIIEQARRCIECKVPKCMIEGCPLHNRIPEWMNAVAAGDIREAARISNTTSNLPEICGRVCPQHKLCEGHCTLSKKAGAVSIGRIERFINDWTREHGGLEIPEIPAATGFKVACIGSGPASIAVADELRKKGHDVTVFEKNKVASGLLHYGIPPFKLNKEVVGARIERLEKMGVEFVLNTEVGKDLTLADLKEKQGFDAVFIGIGAPLCKSARCDGEDLGRVFSADEFLMRNNVAVDDRPDDMKENIPVGISVIVFGGGNTAMDCVRTGIRAGYEKVYCFYRRSQLEMPAGEKERVNAEEEGVEFQYLVAPSRFLANGGNVVAEAECFRMELGEPDDSGRRRPIKLEDSEFTVDIDTVVLAIGYDNDPSFSDDVEGLDTDKWGCVIVDNYNGQSSLEWVFSGGDAVHGADLVVTAVAAGRRAAAGMDAFLKGEPMPKKPEEKSEEK